MANELGQMTVKLGLDASGLNGGIGQAASKLAGFASAAPGLLGPVGTVLAVAGTLAIGLGVAATKAAGDFQQSMLKNVAAAGLGKSSMQSFGDQILAMAPQVAQMPLDLSNGLYQIMSAGVPAAKAMDTLRYASEAAAIGNTSVTNTAKPLAAMMFDWGVSSKQAADMMVSAVGQGNFTVAQYAASIGKLGSTAASAHMSMAQTNAALDVLSYAFPSAAQASTGLSSLFTIMDIKTDTLAKRALKLGLSFDETKFKTLDLAGQVQYLDKMTGNNQGQLLAILGQKNALQAISALSKGSSQYTDILKSLQAGQLGAGSTASSFATTQEGLNFKVTQLQAAFQVFLITVGQKIIPVLSQLIGATIPVITGITALASGTGKATPIVKGLGDVFTWAKPYVIQMGTAVIGFVEQVETRLGPAIKGFMIFWNAAWPSMWLILQGVWNLIVGFVRVIWAELQGFILIGLDIIGGKWGQAWIDMKNMLAGVLGGLGQMFGGAIQVILGVLLGAGTAIWDAMTAPFLSAFHTISGIFGSIGTAIGDISSGNFSGAVSAVLNIPGFASGTDNAPGGLSLVGENGPELMYVPRGASITPHGSSPLQGSSSGGNVTEYHTHVYLDSREIMHSVQQQADRKVRLKLGAKGRVA